MNRKHAFNIDRAVIESAASAKSERLLTTLLGRGESSAGQLETQALIEMRYQQHLAQQGLQELFESGEIVFS